MMGFSHLYRSNNDGSDVLEADIEHIPYQLEFESTFQFPNERMQLEWWEQLRGILPHPD